ncbi:Polydeoxyribonucleotide synthase [Hyphodiscus hymeniophilus]|uniref:DNA ligase n=1 Tax=Hyphodiscus hymeniophilus TaxID=353542 RepID=A0A9P6VJ61_9HELO|nr:Polydeoxyribonucleotide synthase [Hyphodiscus hymeniophilus]
MRYPEDADDDGIIDHERQYGHGPVSDTELDIKYPGRPKNIHKTLPFHDLFESLFDPLLENAKGKKINPPIARRKQGPHGPARLTPTEIRHTIIQRFISKWRAEVGNDFYPALRLIVPDKDRDRPMYGLKERAIAKLLIKLLKIGSKTEDAMNLLNWKLPSQSAASGDAGDFPSKCHAVLKKRPMRTEVGDMRIAEVNELLDKLAAAQKEESQLPIFTEFYNRMNPAEMHWLIRIILRRLNMGSTEKTFFNHWHPDADALFNVSSSLRRVCWELHNENVRLEGDSTTSGIALMSCFQPQLAQFQSHSFQKAVERLGVSSEDNEFWIEEKLDGERIQLHMIEDDEIDGGRRFAFWSRKAKDYTYLYGNGFKDDNSSLTRHIEDAFKPVVRNIILDGEMITWDPEADIMVPFGTLKTAALSEQRDPFAGNGIRPLFRVFDCLYLNDQDITRYTLRDRRNALEQAIQNVHRRLEKHDYTSTENPADIEPRLRDVVTRGLEGLVLKNPRSIYQLNSRVDDWMKVKPEYMNEFGENLDCLVIGGFYGSGHRGGRLSSFLCGLRVDKNDIDRDPNHNPMRFFSFFKVGGGFTVQDYNNIAEKTHGKWTDWDRKKPPTVFIDVGSGEVPDVWIKPDDSIVIEVKAASVIESSSFQTKYSLRFPRFRKLRSDKDWTSALSAQEFMKVKAEAEAEASNKTMTVEGSRKRITKRLKKQTVIAGYDSKIQTPYAGPRTGVFEGLNFCVLSDMVQPTKKSKALIEQTIKNNGGRIFQSATAESEMIVVGDKNVVKVASLIKAGQTDIVRATWVFDAVKQSETDGLQMQRLVLPREPNHMLHITDGSREQLEANVDEYGDSYARNVTPEELKVIMANMRLPKNSSFSSSTFLSQLEDHGKQLVQHPGSLFRGCVVRFAPSDLESLELRLVKYDLTFACGKVAEDDSDESITHFVVVDENAVDVRGIRRLIAESGRRRIPRLVRLKWMQDSWTEKTVLDEEKYNV